jgi:hypothetical protein
MDCVAAGGSQQRATARPELWQFSRSSASWRGHMTGILSVGSRQMPPTSRIETADSLTHHLPLYQNVHETVIRCQCSAWSARLVVNAPNSLILATFETDARASTVSHSASSTIHWIKHCHWFATQTQYLYLQLTVMLCQETTPRLDVCCSLRLCLSFAAAHLSNQRRYLDASAPPSGGLR